MRYMVEFVSEGHFCEFLIMKTEELTAYLDDKKHAEKLPKSIWRLIPYEEPLKLYLSYMIGKDGTPIWAVTDKYGNREQLWR